MQSTIPMRLFRCLLLHNPLIRNKYNHKYSDLYVSLQISKARAPPVTQTVCIIQVEQKDLLKFASLQVAQSLGSLSSPRSKTLLANFSIWNADKKHISVSDAWIPEFKHGTEICAHSVTVCRNVFLWAFNQIRPVHTKVLPFGHSIKYLYCTLLDHSFNVLISYSRVHYHGYAFSF